MGEKLMPLKSVILTVCAVLVMVAPAYARLQCQEVAGTLLLTPDRTCQIKRRENVQQFPDVVFLEPNSCTPFTCFTGDVNGTLDKQRITGKSVSGLTANAFAQTFQSPQGCSPIFTAATVVRLFNARNKFIGRLFLRDFGVMNADGTVTEELVVIGGTGEFKDAKGTLAVQGNEFAPPGASVSGTICSKQDDDDDDD
jgi:hypothetical protein